MPAAKFKLCTAVMQVPLRTGLRQRVLASALSPAQDEIYKFPIGQWLTVKREDFSGYECSIPRPYIVEDITLFDPAHPILSKMGIYQGPVTNLGFDAIVNAANEVCLGGGGVDSAVHRAAGPLLARECATHNGCKTGQTLITKGYNLAARYVVHTVGPVGEGPALLRSCYQSVLSLASENGLRSVGVCGISTGVYGYPLMPATHIAVQEVSDFIRTNPDAIDFVAFACYLDSEVAAVKEVIAFAKEAGLFD